MKAFVNGNVRCGLIILSTVIGFPGLAKAQTVVDFRETVRQAESALVRVIVEPDTATIKDQPKAEAGNEANQPKLQLHELDAIPEKRNFIAPVKRIEELKSSGFAAADNLIIASIEYPVTSVKVLGRRGEEFDGEVVAFDYVTGLAAIRVSDGNFVPLVISVAPVEAGMPVVAVHQGQRTIHANVGTIATAAMPAESGVGPVPEVHFSVRPDTPGTVVLDATGIVVGMMVPSQSGTLCCVDPSALMRLSSSADGPAGQLLKRGLVGIQFEGGGALVLEVSPDSAAEKAGILAGDLVQQVGKIEIQQSSDVIAAVENARAGEQIAITVLRDVTEKTLSVELLEHPRQWSASRSIHPSDFPQRVLRLENGRIVPFPGPGIQNFEEFDQMFRRFDEFKRQNLQTLPKLEENRLEK
ncbi:S1C family serine protease [Stieleria sp. JC731]|uniref:PDZ domain-containing protein n=1 Tax=Pirellulaceae TaxID=2691357 RepID=UPI001E4DC4B3|nr:S1C family serine protease [Stieleria sp. JC731]